MPWLFMKWVFGKAALRHALDAKTLQQIAQKLITAGTKISVVRAAKKSAEFGLSNFKSRLFDEWHDIGVLEFKSHSYFFQNHVVGDAFVSGQ